MERYNIFNLIHKGLRASLYQTALQLQQTDFTSDEETESAVNRVKEIIMLFDAHAHKEDSFILPAISSWEPSVVATFESEHVEDLKLGEELKASIGKVENATGLTGRLAAGIELTESFVAFTIFNLKHMAREEDIINKILWRYYSDDEIKKISAQISESVEPWMQDFYATWMLRGINTPEAATWMKAIEKGAPPIVFQTLLQKAEQELPQQRFRKITESLSEGVFLAN